MLSGVEAWRAARKRIPFDFAQGDSLAIYVLRSGVEGS